MVWKGWLGCSEQQVLPGWLVYWLPERNWWEPLVWSLLVLPVPVRPVLPGFAD